MKPFTIGCGWIWYAHGTAPDDGSRALRGLASERLRISIKQPDLVRSIYAMGCFYSDAGYGADDEDRKTAKQARAVRDRAKRWLKQNSPDQLNCRGSQS